MELISFLQLLQAELLQRGTPLPEIFTVQAARKGVLENSFTDCAVQMKSGLPADKSMQPLLHALYEREGLPDAAELLEVLALALGKYDAATQAERCKQTCLRLEEQEKQLQQLHTEKRRLYRALSLSAGAVLALMLW